MIGELTIADETLVNVNNIAPQTCPPGTVVCLDAANSTPQKLAFRMPTGANDLAYGVAVDSLKQFFDPVTGTATIPAGQGLPVRRYGIASCIAGGTIAVGDRVAIAGTAGTVVTIAQTAGGSQPKPIVGQALTAAVSGQGVFVALMIGATW